MFACEVRHFCFQLLSGNVRSIEALCCPPDGVVLSTQQWSALQELLDPKTLVNKAFVSQCLGQSIGGLVRKKKVRGRLVIRDDTSLEKFADSFRYMQPFVSTHCEFYLLFSRLLGYLELLSGGRGLVTWTGNPLSELENCPEAAQAMELLQQAFEVSDL